MKYVSTLKALNEVKSDAIVVPLFENKKVNNHILETIDELSGGKLSKLIKSLEIKGSAGSIRILPIDNLLCKQIILLSFGANQEASQDTIQKCATALASELQKTNIKHLSIVANETPLDDEFCISLIRAIETSTYSFDQYKSKKDDKSKLSQVSFTCDKENQALIKKSITYAQALAAGMQLTKDLGNQPGNVCTPTYLANEAKKLVKENAKFKITILEEKDMAKQNMGAFLSVSKGSTEPGKLIAIQYEGGKKTEAPHILIGKGITFDTGGISLKPGAQMDEMKYDMCGAASVLGTMQAIALLKPKINIVGIIAAAENMPAGNASKPGDIVTTSSGQTVEIMNTDAEGRLVLCDALTYAEKFKPASVVDIATLTGACIIALGHHTSAVMSNDDDLAQEILDAGQQAQDKAWQLPIWDEYDAQINSPFADMQNIGGKGAGSITAACFLARFAKNFKWAHLDIAGTAWVSGGKDKGATGRPVPLLLQYLLNKS